MLRAYLCHTPQPFWSSEVFCDKFVIWVNSPWIRLLLRRWKSSRILRIFRRGEIKFLGVTPTSNPKHEANEINSRTPVAFRYFRYLITCHCAFLLLIDVIQRGHIFFMLRNEINFLICISLSTCYVPDFNQFHL